MCLTKSSREILIEFATVTRNKKTKQKLLLSTHAFGCSYSKKLDFQIVLSSTNSKVVRSDI